MSDIHTPVAVGPAASSRRRRLVWIGCGTAAALAAVTAWRLHAGDTQRRTDDAYVNGHVVSITPQLPGAVSTVAADNADRVVAGQVLLQIDASDARIALAVAQADLARTERRVHGMFAAEAQAHAVIQLRQVDVERARADLNARQGLVAQGAVPEEEVRHAADAVKAAQSALVVAERTHAEALAQTRGVTQAVHPDVLLALEKVRAAALALERTTVRAPVSGMVAQRSVQLGKQVAPGDRLMAIVPLDQLWVDANFKEVQLDGICRGQPARVTADVYGTRVTYRGTVEDIEAGSGAAFALLPAQNATGNWIKVVQRVPVRIRLDAQDLAQHPLRIGMSTETVVDTRDCPSGQSLSTQRATESATIYAAQQQAADQRLAAYLASRDSGRRE